MVQAALTYLLLCALFEISDWLAGFGYSLRDFPDKYESL